MPWVWVHGTISESAENTDSHIHGFATNFDVVSHSGCIPPYHRRSPYFRPLVKSIRPQSLVERPSNIDGKYKVSERKI